MPANPSSMSPDEQERTTERPAIRLAGVVRTFVRGGEEVPVLRGVDGEVARGETVAVIGPSGSGKSTLLNIVGTLDRPTSGAVEVAGREVGAMDARALAGFRCRNLGFVFQNHYLLPQCTVLENVLVPTLALGDRSAREAARPRAEKLLQRVGLGPRRLHRPAQLSGGECQRVAVVRALINRPGLVLADEPTGALDRKSADGLADLLLELNAEDGTTLVVATHSTALAERMGRALEIRDGRIVPDEGRGG